STSSVGDYAITASNATGSGLGNYTISYSAGAYTITPAALSITANHQTGTYGQSPTLGTSAFTATGLLNSDTISGISLATNATSTSSVGDYAITASNATGSGLGNYTISYSAGAYTITPAALSITANHQTGTYGQSPTLGTSAFTATGLLNSDTISGISLATNATSTSSVGDYAITASNATGSGLGNYTISYSAGAYTITPVALTITALNQSGPYRQVPALDNTAFTTNGLLNSDVVSSVSLATPATSASSVGTYDITASDATGTGLGNYTITYHGGLYTVLHPQMPSGAHPIFWPLISIHNGNIPISPPFSPLPAADASDTEDAAGMRNSSLALQNIPDSTLPLGQSHDYRIEFPSTVYSNRLKDTF
ncbi:MBG domain-containing protein, partial [Acetobacter fabarum]|uniref:MBG domain-containing protein n=1 Tax=Acetobacter fabarum TaxID=483199 RepID=UPI00312BB82F